MTRIVWALWVGMLMSVGGCATDLHEIARCEGPPSVIAEQCEIACNSEPSKVVGASCAGRHDEPFEGYPEGQAVSCDATFSVQDVVGCCRISSGSDYTVRFFQCEAS